jgi:hypothetical protein
VLPAARTTEGMVEELLGWASQMPIFATHLTGAHVPFLTCSLHLLLMIHSCCPCQARNLGCA